MYRHWGPVLEGWKPQSESLGISILVPKPPWEGLKGTPSQSALLAQALVKENEACISPCFFGRRSQTKITPSNSGGTSNSLTHRTGPCVICSCIIQLAIRHPQAATDNSCIGSNLPGLLQVSSTPFMSVFLLSVLFFCSLLPYFYFKPAARRNYSQISWI